LVNSHFLDEIKRISD
jgi:hypothetical protein